jgi:hypothetical protein
MIDKVLTKPNLIISLVLVLLIIGTSTVLSAERNEPNQTGTLTLTKNVINDGGGSALPNDFNLTVNGTPVDSGVANIFDAGIELVINETQLTDYMFVDITPDLDCPDNIGETIILSDSDNITCTITNRYIPIEITPTSDLLTYEDGSSPATFDVKLKTAPSLSSQVTIPISSSNPNEGIADESSLDFNDTDWSVPKTVTVTGVNDDFDDGDILYTIQIGTVTSTDPIFDGLNPADIDYTNIDNDTFGISVDPIIGLLTSESGAFDTFEVVLDSKPFSADVQINLHSTKTSEGIIDKATLTFLQDEWNIPQVVMVTGVDDPIPIAEGDVPYQIITQPAISGDPDYNGLDPDDVDVINSDNDEAGYTVTPTSGLWTNEGGRADKVKILLKTKPFESVELKLVSNNQDEGITIPATDTIDPQEWQPDTFFEYQIIGIDDQDNDGDIPYQVEITTKSDDPAYHGFTETIDIINYDSPTITWVFPVGDEQTFDVENLSPILLQVNKVGTEPIDLVQFYRWVPSRGLQVIIGEDNHPPFRQFLDPSDIDFEYNQVYAYAIGSLPEQGEEVKDYSIHKWIFIYRPTSLGTSLFFPLVFNP